MSVAGDFQRAWTEDDDPLTAVMELLPVRLARACVQILPVDGAGLSLFSADFRVPLGADSPSADSAERLQFTVGEGPCLEAVRTGRPVRVTASDIQRRWPVMFAELISSTPYRSIVSVPLGPSSHVRGALDLYLRQPTRSQTVDVGAARAVADQIAAVLTMTRSTVDSIGALPGPAWLHGPTPQHRLRVWIAIGMLNAELGLSAPDGLARMRAHAYAHNAVLDDIAASLVNRALAAVDLEAE